MTAVPVMHERMKARGQRSLWWYGPYMASVKATFTLDPETASRLARMADQLQRSKSEIVREAVADYGARIDRLGERERARMLAAFDDLIPRIPQRAASEVDVELADLRAARESGGRRSPAADL